MIRHLRNLWERGGSPYPLPLGRVLVTPAAEGALKAAGVPLQDLLRRHVRGDFGEITPEEREENERNAREGGQITSVYTIGHSLPPSQVMILSGAPEGAVVILLGE